LSTNEHAREIIRAVIGLGRGLKLPIVAEGVETKEQISFLSDEQCYGMQGYFIGRPQPIGVYNDLTGCSPIKKAAGASSARLP
jgi:EAL domain-containing protein (putative c-di-GMP-specific phosphodiesterase class I)